MSKRHKNLTHIISSFGFRPNLLAKYLLENGLLRADFLETLDKGDYSQMAEEKKLFTHFSQIREYYTDQLKTFDLTLPKEQLALELNKKLDQMISCEKYEEAAAIRDLMILKKIKRKAKKK
jgi:hypothetical protein